QTAIDHAITVSKGGYNKAKGLLTAAKGVANQALAQGDSQGLKIPLSAATNGLQQTLDRIGDSADINGDLKTLTDIEKDIMGGRSGDLTMGQADGLKRDMQLKAQAAYRAAQMGDKTGNLKALAYKDMAAHLNASIDEALASKGITGYRAANGNAQEMIGLTK